MLFLILWWDQSQIDLNQSTEEGIRSCFCSNTYIHCFDMYFLSACCNVNIRFVYLVPFFNNLFATQHYDVHSSSPCAWCRAIGRLHRKKQSHEFLITSLTMVAGWSCIFLYGLSFFPITVAIKLVNLSESRIYLLSLSRSY